MRTHISHNLNAGKYTKIGGKNITYYDGQFNRRDYAVNDSYIFSHRKFKFSQDNFNDTIDSHDFFEIIIYVCGDVQYISEDQVASPKNLDIIISAPGTMHASRLLSPSTYERYVLQFGRGILAPFGQNSLLSFAESDPSHWLLSPPEEKKTQILTMLSSIEESLISDEENSAPLALSYTVQLFNLICSFSGDKRKSEEKMPDTIHKIKQYIDDHFTDISSATEVATNFYYSREYVSRLFKRYFNTTISDYISKKRINESKKILAAGGSVTDACYESGYRNMSSYIKAFTNICGTTPSKYRKSVIE